MAAGGPDSVIVLLPIAGFTLMTDRKNQDGILVLLKAIEGHITGTSSRYHQLSQFILYRTADQWMTR